MPCRIVRAARSINAASHASVCSLLVGSRAAAPARQAIECVPVSVQHLLTIELCLEDSAYKMTHNLLVYTVWLSRMELILSSDLHLTKNQNSGFWIFSITKEILLEDTNPRWIFSHCMYLNIYH